MNWDSGLKRITLVLSVVGAVVGGGWLFYDSLRVLNHNASLLERQRQVEFFEFLGSLLIDEWKQAKTSEDQERLWVEWTGKRVPAEFVWRTKPTETNTVPPFEIIGKALTIEELPQLDGQGWHTVVDGQPLILTPRDVWQLQHDREIKDLERTIPENKIELAVAPLFGAVLGFGVVWVLYAIVNGAAWPLLTWITQGFRDDKQKDRQETDESGPA